MSTRSLIAIKNKDNSIDSIYCHSDGYPSHVGRLLLNNYNNKEEARNIINLGGLSFLDEKLSPSQEYEDCRYDWKVTGKVKHSFDTPHKGVSISYHRDRGEELSINNFKSEEEWNNSEHWCDYLYLWKDNKWHVDGEELTKELIIE